MDNLINRDKTPRLQKPKPLEKLGDITPPQAKEPLYPQELVSTNRGRVENRTTRVPRNLSREPEKHGNYGKYAKDHQYGRKMRPPRRKQKPHKWPIIAILTVLGIVVLLVGFSLFLKAKYERKIVGLDAAGYKERDAVLILGCGVYNDGSPTPMLRDRMMRGIEAYYKGAGKKLILSGDHGQKNYDEVSTMKQIALEYGVPEDDIFLDHAGFSTYESMKRAKDIFGAESLCVVTQRYHLYRALYLADSLEIDASGVAADGDSYKGQWLREIREILARAKDIFNATFKPSAEIMGKEIDLSGSGVVTWN